jgi:hypothetical protein
LPNEICSQRAGHLLAVRFLAKLKCGTAAIQYGRLRGSTLKTELSSAMSSFRRSWSHPIPTDLEASEVLSGAPLCWTCSCGCVVSALFRNEKNRLQRRVWSAHAGKVMNPAQGVGQFGKRRRSLPVHNRIDYAGSIWRPVSTSMPVRIPSSP